MRYFIYIYIYIYTRGGGGVPPTRFARQLPFLKSEIIVNSVLLFSLEVNRKMRFILK